MIQFTTQFHVSKAEVGIAAWQEQGDKTLNGIRSVTGTALLVVKMLVVNEYTDDDSARLAVEEYLGTDEANRAADVFDLNYSGSLYQMNVIQAGKDTFFVWVNWIGSRELDEERPGEREWAGSRGVGGSYGRKLI